MRSQRLIPKLNLHNREDHLLSIVVMESLSSASITNSCIYFLGDRLTVEDVGRESVAYCKDRNHTCGDSEATHHAIQERH